MDTAPAQRICICGRTFLQPGALKKHLNSCSKSKKRMSVALGKAQEGWTSRKRKRIADLILSPALEHEGVDKVCLRQAYVTLS